MDNTNFSPRLLLQRLLLWVLPGAVMAYLSVTGFSYLYTDAGIRKVPVLVAVSLAGAAGGWLVCKINPGGKLGWQKLTSLAFSVVLYSSMVFLSFVVARLGGF